MSRISGMFECLGYFRGFRAFNASEVQECEKQENMKGSKDSSFGAQKNTHAGSRHFRTMRRIPVTTPTMQATDMKTWYQVFQPL